MEKTRFVSVYDRENILLKLFNFQSFFQMNPKFFECASLLTSAPSAELYFAVQNESIIYFLTIARQKCHSLFAELVRPIEKLYDHASELKRRKIDIPPVSKEEAWATYKGFIKSLAFSFVAFAKELPGFERMCQHDFITVVLINMSIFIPLLNSRINKGDDYQLVIGSTLIDKNYLMEFFGKSILDTFIETSQNLNGLSLTNEETSLLLPFIVTSTSIGFFLGGIFFLF